MRNARRVFGNAAVVGERCYRFCVLEERGAQGEPLGLEDGNTAFSEALSRDLFQQGHGTGSRQSARNPPKSEEGEPVHPSPPPGAFFEPPPVRTLVDRRASILFPLYSASASVLRSTDANLRRFSF